MTEQHIKEQISRAYAKAIAANAGIILREFEGVDYGFDGRFSGVDVDFDGYKNRFSENGFGIDFQIKATTNIYPKNGKILYDLEVKNYKDLIKVNVGTQRILIIYSMPKSRLEWLTITNDELVLKRCAWWCSLRGMSDTPNKHRIRIEIPDHQKLTSDELTKLMKQVKEGAVL